MTDEQILQRRVELLKQDEFSPKKQIYCSMADPNLPEGTQFLGAVVVSAQSYAWAIEELNKNSLNLGGQILFGEIPNNKIVPQEWTYRILNAKEARNLPIIEVSNNE